MIVAALFPLDTEDHFQSGYCYTAGATVAASPGLVTASVKLQLASQERVAMVFSECLRSV